MPIYEYQCTSCNHHFEVTQKISEKPLKKCPTCGGKVTKLLSQTAFHLKGSGWYTTDYTNKKSPSSTTVPSTVSTPETKKDKKEASVPADKKMPCGGSCQCVSS